MEVHTFGKSHLLLSGLWFAGVDLGEDVLGLLGLLGQNYQRSCKWLDWDEQKAEEDFQGAKDAFERSDEQTHPELKGFLQKWTKTQHNESARFICNIIALIIWRNLSVVLKCWTQQWISVFLKVLSAQISPWVGDFDQTHCVLWIILHQTHERHKQFCGSFAKRFRQITFL